MKAVIRSSLALSFYAIRKTSRSTLAPMLINPPIGSINTHLDSSGIVNVNLK